MVDAREEPRADHDVVREPLQLQGVRNNPLLYRYLHVHKEWDEDDAGFTAPKGLSAPIRAFSHAELDQEGDLRSRFRRVYECRQYVCDLTLP